MDDNVKLSHNSSDNRYEMHLDDKLVGWIDYSMDGHVQNMHHTEVDPEHGGRGLGERLVEFALADARENERQVEPTCPFISRYIDKNPEYQDLKDVERDGADYPGIGVPGTMGTNEQP